MKKDVKTKSSIPEFQLKSQYYILHVETSHLLSKPPAVLMVSKNIYFIPSSDFNAYLKQIKIILSAVKKYRIFSLVMNTIFIFSL